MNSGSEKAIEDAMKTLVIIGFIAGLALAGLLFVTVKIVEASPWR